MKKKPSPAQPPSCSVPSLRLGNGKLLSYENEREWEKKKELYFMQVSHVGVAIRRSPSDNRGKCGALFYSRYFSTVPK